jgi:GNAT superfamily N-acetyltransferase
MDQFYAATTHPEPPHRQLPQIEDAIFGATPAAHVVLARNDTAVVAFAAYSFLWPAAGVTRSLYLKELYVGQAYRREGVGKLLMHHLCDIAATSACSRIEWTTDQDNPGAQQFYARLGHIPNPSKLFYRRNVPFDPGSV